MTENIAYKICTCDVCGHIEHINLGVGLPPDWLKINVGDCIEYDACPKCAKATVKFLNSKKEHADETHRKAD